MNENELLEMQELFMQNEAFMDPEMIQVMTTADIASNIISVIFFLLSAWGIWKINKKLGEPYPWLAWIPLIQLYSVVKAGGKKWFWIIWIILGTILMYILIVAAFFFFLFAMGSGGLFVGSVLISLILGLTPYTIVLHGISKRTGRGWWSTVGMLLIPFIMFPVIGHKLNLGPTPDMQAIKPKAQKQESQDEL